MLGQPVDLEVRVELAQLVGDRRRRASRGRARSARRCTGRGAGGRARASRCGSVEAVIGRPPSSERTKSRISRLARTGWRPGIMWFAPSTTTSGAPGQLGEPVGPRDRLAAVLGAVDEEHRAADGPAGRLDRLAVEREVGAVATRRASPRRTRRRAQPAASSIAFVECGSVVISEKKNRGESGIVAPPVVAVHLRPALVRGQLVVERVLEDET